MSKAKKRKEIKKGFGTKEWADTNVNCYYGCSNDCKYCYAKRMALRFKRETNESWKTMYPNINAINKEYKKREGRIMFPTSHDITPETYPNCLIVLKKLLDAGNEVLITTKPNLTVITKLICELDKYQEQIQFRFTITSIDNKVLRFWEPYAPNYNERKNSLILARSFNYKTSVSIEPFLDEDPYPLIKDIAPYCSESIWIGKLNYIKNRINSWENIQKVIDNLSLLPDKIKKLIRIKDSIRKMYGKRGLELGLCLK